MYFSYFTPLQVRNKSVGRGQRVVRRCVFTQNQEVVELALVSSCSFIVKKCPACDQDSIIRTSLNGSFLKVFKSESKTLKFRGLFEGHSETGIMGLL